MKLKYKNYVGTYEYDDIAKEYHGHVLGIQRSVIHFCSKTRHNLQKEFEKSIEFYLESCKEDNIIPEKSCTGEMKIRIKPEVHSQLLREAQYKGISLNSYMQSLIDGRKDSEFKR